MAVAAQLLKCHEDIVPVPDVIGKLHIVTNHLSARRGKGMEQRHSRPYGVESIYEISADGIYIVSLFRLGLCFGHELAGLSDVGIKDICHLMELCGVHIVLVVKHCSPCLLHDLPIGIAHGHNAVKILLCIVEYCSHHAVEHIGEEKALLCDGIVLVLLGKRVQGLGLEGYAPLSQAQTQPVHTQLLRGVEVQKFCRHGRLYTAAGGCLFVKEQYVMVGNGHRHGQMTLCVTG